MSLKMINGDGNFHLTQQSRAKGIFSDPSVFGDAGFWVNEKTAREYTAAAERLKSSKLVSFTSRFGLNSLSRPGFRSL